MNQKALLGYVTEMDSGDPWYQPYIDYCREQGIISKDYPWDKNATRAGYVEIFAHALPEDALYARNDIADDTIPDVGMNHPQSAEIYLLYRAGVLTGNDKSGTFNPSSNIKRCEVAAILTRMLDDSARKDVVTGAPAPDVDRSAEFAVLAGTWSENDWSKGSISTLEIDSKGNWIYIEYISVGAVAVTIEHSGTIDPAAGEPNAYYAIDKANNESFYFKFTPAEENDIGIDSILWGGENHDIVSLRGE